MKKLIIATNLGRVRVLKFREAGEDPIEQDHLVESPGKSTETGVESVHETVTDQAGRFSRGAAVGFQTGMSHADEHNLELEIERSALKRVANRIERILETEGSPAWILAAPQTILARLKDSLPPSACRNLLAEVGADLTKTPLQDLEKRFL
jgi:hypothetical protein